MTPKQMMPKPSDAITAMIDGLRSVSKREDFEVAMGTYGAVFGGVCYGCAATCTVLHVLPDAPVDENDRIAELEHWYDWMAFESVINQLRKGRWADLGHYYGVRLPRPSRNLIALWDETWRYDLHTFEAYRDQLLEWESFDGL